jgi:hypothetical protein
MNPSPKSVDYSLELRTLYEELNDRYCWFHTRMTSIPGEGDGGNPLHLMTLQKAFLSASDYFGGLHMMTSKDGGKNWTPPEEIPELKWRQEGERVDGVCDVTPGWHPQLRRVIAIGHTVHYVHGKLMESPRPRSTAYSYYDIYSGRWSAWRTIEMPDEEDLFWNCGAGCAQWLVEPDGSLLVPVYFIPRSTYADARFVARATAMRCKADEYGIEFLEHGNILEYEVPRGLCEPSLTFYNGRYYMTLRNDKGGFVTVSDDGLNYAPLTPWRFDDGEELGSYNTQQHWAAHSDGLFLVYTRKGADNDHVMRHRAPLFIAQVDPERLCVLRETEQVAVPERGAALGNFGVSAPTPHETWITAGENMYHEAAKERARGAVLAGVAHWEAANKLHGRVL